MASERPYFPQEIIRRKRDGATLTDDEISFIVKGITDNSVTEGQAAAFAMAVFFQGMSAAECAALTRAMTRSGTVLDWSAAGLDGPVLDKHSTGGVGDKVSLMLAPIIAACGGFVPMISGRGLGHTGGTLDKLDAIPGYDTGPDRDTFMRTVRDVGCAIIGQTADLAPADRRLYAIRDVTATGESIPLITASILSKKLAAGLDGLVMDVKFGNGSFAGDRDNAVALAHSIVDVAAGAGLKCSALLTDMNQVLGHSAGNALEVREAIAYLTGAHRDPRVHGVTIALCAELLRIGGLAATEDEAQAMIDRALASGTAAEIFGRMVAALGGPADLVERPDAHLPIAPVIRPVCPLTSGYLAATDTRALGVAVMGLGGGRHTAGDAIDYSVGLSDMLPLGSPVAPDTPLCTVHAGSGDDADRAVSAVLAAVTIGEQAGGGDPVVQDRIAA